MSYRWNLVAAVALTLAPPAVASLDLAPVREIPVQDGGRIKPLDTLCREAVLAIADEESIDGRDPVAAVLSMAFEPEAWKDRSVIAVSYRPFRSRLGMGPREGTISAARLVENEEFGRMVAQVEAAQAAGRELNAEEKEMSRLYHRVAMLQAIGQWRTFTIVPGGTDPEARWISIAEAIGSVQSPQGGSAARPHPATETSWRKLKEAWVRQDSSMLGRAAAELSRTLRDVAPGIYPDGSAVRLETSYNILRPFRKAALLYLLALLVLVARLYRDTTPLRGASILLLTIAYALHVVGIGVRVYLSGRGPISNLYESMIYMGWGGVTFALAFAPWYGLKHFGLAASGLAAALIYLADWGLDPFIAPLVPVLRSNWLWFHVQMIMLGYAGLGLAIVLGHVRLVLAMLGRARSDNARTIDEVLHRAIQVGCACLGTGIVLGGIWADYSWGRYWGWDPKETWSLITLLCYLAVLHGRFAGWLTSHGVAVGAVLGVFPLLTTYYGVNFLLVGLHSYAGRDPNSGATFLDRLMDVPIWLKAFVLAEVAFLAAAQWTRFWRRGARAPHGLNDACPRIRGGSR